MRIRNALKQILKNLFIFYGDNKYYNILIASTPRSGSTWLMELLLNNKSYIACNEPFNIRDKLRKNVSGFDNWDDIYNNFKENSYLYLNDILNGKRRELFVKNYPWGKNYFPLKKNIVIKMLHAGENEIQWLKQTFNLRIVYLVRHPIAVSLSRKELPRLSTLIGSEFSSYFTKDQLTLAKKIKASGTYLEMAILSWCMQNKVLHDNLFEDDLLIFYENLVCNPNQVINKITASLDNFNKKHEKKMIALHGIPSASTSQSGQSDMKILRSGNANKIISKWTDKLSKEQKNRVQEILNEFNIKFYNAFNVLPLK